VFLAAIGAFLLFLWLVAYESGILWSRAFEIYFFIFKWINGDKKRNKFGKYLN
jgi:hypothetical protein